MFIRSWLLCLCQKLSTIHVTAAEYPGNEDDSHQLKLEFHKSYKKCTSMYDKRGAHLNGREKRPNWWLQHSMLDAQRCVQPP